MASRYLGSLRAEFLLTMPSSVTYGDTFPLGKGKAVLGGARVKRSASKFVCITGWVLADYALIRHWHAKLLAVFSLHGKGKAALSCADIAALSFGENGYIYIVPSSVANATPSPP